MRISVFKFFMLLVMLFVPVKPLLAQDVDFNYGMTNWRDYGFQSIPKEIFDLLQRGNYKRAIFKLRPYMNNSNGRVNPEAWFLNARALLNERDYKVAQRTAQRVMNHFPDHPEMLAVMSMSYLYGRNDFDYATDYAERVAEACDDCKLSKYLMRLIDDRKRIKDIL